MNRGVDFFIGQVFDIAIGLLISQHDHRLISGPELRHMVKRANAESVEPKDRLIDLADDDFASSPSAASTP